MNKEGVGIGALVVMVAFALSCFGLLLFLWVSFGGPVPLRPQPYEISAGFNQGEQLATYADVRISGVTVGKVVKVKQLNGDAEATMKIQPKYAPLPKDTTATLREKTLIGEVFVDLSFGSRRGPTIPDRGRIAPQQIKKTVKLDEIFDAFNKPTRENLKRFIMVTAKATDGRGVALNQAFGQLGPALESGDGLLSTLNRQSAEIRSGTADLGTVFQAVGQRAGAVQELVHQGRRIVDTTAQITTPLRQTLRIIPTFLDETKATLVQARLLAKDAAPAVADLRPVTPLVRPALRDLEVVAPSLRRTLTDIDPVITKTKTGLPALRRVLRSAGPAFDQISPVASDLLPIVQYVQAYKSDASVSFANAAAATESQVPDSTGRLQNLLRLTLPLNGETLMNAQKPSPLGRSNSYPLPGSLEEQPFKTFSCENTKNPRTALSLLLDIGGAPPCVVQRKFDTKGVLSQFPRLLKAEPKDQAPLATRAARGGN